MPPQRICPYTIKKRFFQINITSIFLRHLAMPKIVRGRGRQPDVFYKKDALKNFANFTENHLCWSLLRPVTLLKGDSSKSAFLLN